jgi:hypothetical protein
MYLNFQNEDDFFLCIYLDCQIIFRDMDKVQNICRAINATAMVRLTQWKNCSFSIRQCCSIRLKKWNHKSDQVWIGQRAYFEQSVKLFLNYLRPKSSTWETLLTCRLKIWYMCYLQTTCGSGQKMNHLSISVIM